VNTSGNSNETRTLKCNALEKTDFNNCSVVLQHVNCIFLNTSPLFHIYVFLLLPTESNKVKVKLSMPVTVAERSKACTVFARSEAGIVGSNHTQGMDV
jgi:hypothetical protein